MHRQYKILLIAIVIMLGLVSQGCLKDYETNLVIPEIQNNAVLLNYLEVNSNYINSDEMPSIINVDEVYNNIENYLIIDVRSKEEYSLGHISGAVNIQNDSLINFFNSKPNILDYPKIVIVSNDGQAAAYYTSLLRIYGFNNVYSLNFGIALWNDVFSNAWTEHIGYHKIQEHLDGSRLFPSDVNNPLPEIQTNVLGENKESNIKNLISELIRNGFNAQTTVNLSDSVTTVSSDNSHTYYIFRFDSTEISNFYIICYGSLRLYQSLIIYPLPTGHIQGAYYYDKGDLKSSTNLQSIPSNKQIAVYSVSGQISAYVVAFLRVMGYDAKSLNYGANMFYYNRLIYDFDSFQPYVYRPEDIRNYPFISGSSPN